MGIVLLIIGSRIFSQSAHMENASLQRLKVDSLVNNLNENSKKSLKEFYKKVFAMDSLAEEGLLMNMNRKLSLEKKSVLSHALVYVSKSSILNELVHAYRQAQDTLTRDMIVYTILGARYKFNQTSDLSLKPNKEIFPILFETLTDTLDISRIAEVIKKINGIAWLAIVKWGGFNDLKTTFARDFLGASFNEKKRVQSELLEWWKKNGQNVYWDKKIKMFTLVGNR
ncbi:MAG TPA: hypothetical protein VHO03_14830 [Ignavibacteriales bacterium]|nr:hypothetical protein [Ignavibacteriales bacterium]